MGDCVALWDTLALPLFFWCSYAIMASMIIAYAWRAVNSGAMTGLCMNQSYKHSCFAGPTNLRDHAGAINSLFLCVMRSAELAKFMRRIGRPNVGRLPTHKRRVLKGLARYLQVLPLPRRRCWVSPLLLSRSSLRKLLLTAVFCSTPSAVLGTTDGRRTTPPPARPPSSALGRASTHIWRVHGEAC